MTNYFNARPVAPTALALGTAYQPVDEDSSRELALTIAQAADDRKGADIVLLKVSEVSYLADYFVVVTGFSSAQVRAIARSIEDEVEEKWHRYPTQTEGQAEGSWVLLDYGDVIAHIFMPDEREFYSLEAFWGHAERVDFVPSEARTDPTKS
jgi:ribosome-associated protein